jgi:hypothetical protein
LGVADRFTVAAWNVLAVLLAVRVNAAMVPEAASTLPATAMPAAARTAWVLNRFDRARARIVISFFVCSHPARCAGLLSQYQRSG